MSTGKLRLMIALSLLLAFALLELSTRVGLRVLGTSLDSSYGYPSSLFVPDSQRGYAYVPGFRGHFPNPGYNQIEITINRDGFRDREFPPRSDRRRIIVLGDSIVFGAGVRAEERFTERIAARLCADGRCEVLNLGVNGYQAANYLAVLEDELPRLRPDVVLLGFCMNDIQPKVGMEELETIRPTTFTGRLRSWLATSAFLRLIVRLASLATADRKAYEDRWIDQALVAWSSETLRSSLAETLTRMVKVTEASGARFLAVLLPELHQLQDFGHYGAPYTHAEAVFGGAGIPFVSTREVLASDSPASEIYLPGDNIHFSPSAHDRIASVVAESLDSWIAK